MRPRQIFVELRFTLFVFVALLAFHVSLNEPHAQSGVSAPVLTWQYGGCSSAPFCQTGSYSSPAVADLDSDGKPDVIWGAYDVVALNGANGSLKWRATSGNRVWPGVAVADLTGDGTLEVIVGRNSDQLAVYDRFGNTNWIRSPFGSGEIRTLAVADLENDGRLEIIVGAAGSSSTFQLNVFKPDGSVRTGWPARHAGDPGYGSGLWNANVAVADMDGDGFKELVSTTGSHYITALDRNGNQLRVNGVYAPRQFWSQVGVHVAHGVDLRGWANCGLEHRPDFSASAPAIADVDGNDLLELIVVGNVRNCGTNPYTDLYHLPFMFKLDRTRWSGSGFDWTTIPTAGMGSGPRSQNYNVIENAQPNAVAADLDSDGFKEILFPSYDGKVHVYWLDKTEHGNWPYTIPTSGAPGDDFRFASEPIVVDLNNDGRSEVIFTSWPKKVTGRVGALHLLDYQGVELYRIDLPAPANGAGWNGGLAAPTIANIDSDQNLELLVGTTGSGVVAYELPNTANARVLWGTGRGNYGRTGVSVTAAAPPGDATAPTAAITFPNSGATVFGTISVTSDASDNVGIVGVQFRLDDASLGAEDTEAPYSVAWTTTSASNGVHTLTAVARDAAGNTTTSTAVAITVANDVTAPTVAITSPANGASVSGTMTVTAGASDNVGVVGVQFRLDGSDLGAEDIAAPYAISWNTTEVPNGSHTLTATARDAAGNIATSAAVTVTVANDVTAPTVAITSPANGASVSGTMTVTAGASDDVGVVGVQFRLDGVNLSAESTAAPYSISWDTSATADGPHALTAVARDAAGHTTTSATVTVTVANGTVTRLEETSTLISYVGSWIHGNTSRAWSDGTAALGFGIGQRATFSFSGTGVSWIGFKGPNAGIANVYMDGALTATIDAYAAADSVQAVLYTASALSSGPHVLTIEVTQTKNEASSDYFVVVDAFDVTGATPDTSPPTIAITVPGTGTTVAGTITMTASATDNMGVTGVRFFVDGAQVGAEDTVPPYSITWNTTTASDGSHTLTAVARDGAGNTTSSADVPVTVSNAAPPPPTTATRFENTEPSIIYTPGSPHPPAWWHGSRSRGWSAATASFNRSAGARAAFSFTGTSVSWIGFRAPWAGIARVLVDGTFVAELDLYSTTEEAQTAVFSATNLAADSSHTLTIEVTGMKNANATDNAVVVDAFDVAPASPPPVSGTRFDDTASSSTFPGWTTGDTTNAWSGSTAARSTTPGERATFSFTGTSVSWIGLRGPATGIARVFLDGAFQAEVDTYSPTAIQGVVYTATDLAPANHRLEIEVTGRRNPAATDSLVFVDAFDVMSRFEDRDPSIIYMGAWRKEFVDRAWSGTSANRGSGTAALSATPGARAELTFMGTSVTWIGFREPLAGIADVFLDGSLVARVDLYSPIEEVRVPVFTASGLTAGTHTLRIDVTGDKNPAATGAWVAVDAFDTTLPVPAPTTRRYQEADPSAVYGDGWAQSSRSSLWSGEVSRVSSTAGAQTTFTFTGTSVRWIGERGLDTGIARVSLDGVFLAEVDTRTFVQGEYQVAIFTATGLTPGSHTLTVTVIGRNNEPPGAMVDRVIVDAFDVY